MRTIRQATTITLLVAVGGGGTLTATAPCVSDRTGTLDASFAQTDHQSSGNRVALGCGPPERSAPLDVRLDGQLVWVLPDPRDHGTAWIVAYADGSLDRVTVDTAGPASIEPDFAPPLALGAPPMVTRSAQDTRAISVRSAFDDLEGVVDALPGSRLVTAPYGTTVALTDPTDRYQHGVVGDVLEAASFEIQAADGYRNRSDRG